MSAVSNLSMFQVSEIRVSHYAVFNESERSKISTSRQAYDILHQNWDLGRIQMQEHFFILLLNRANHVIGMSEISTGGVAGTVADPKIIFGIALKSNSSGIILAHNHPSGNLRP